MLSKFILLVLASLAIVLLPAMIFVYTMLQPVEAVDVHLDSSEKTELVFFAVGDQGTGNLRQWQVGSAMEEVAMGGIDGVFLLGDNFYRYGVESVHDWQWRYKFENVYEDTLATTPFYATLGNHDYYGDQIALISYDLEDRGSGRWQMPSRDYLKMFGRAGDQALLKVAFIDTGFYLRNPQDTTQQLDRLLSNSPAARWTIVVTHVPLVSGNDSDVPPDARALWQPILAAHQVDLMLTGHDHNMQLIEQPGWPLTAIAGVGGKSKQALDNPELPGLLFYGPGPGFSRLLVNADQLTIQYFDDTGLQLSEHHLGANESTANDSTSDERTSQN
jgi:tartrate-resistant acid phosphatase type 5